VDRLALGSTAVKQLFLTLATNPRVIHTTRVSSPSRANSVVLLLRTAALGTGTLQDTPHPLDAILIITVILLEGS
jgi:hypothetical protein